MYVNKADVASLSVENVKGKVIAIEADPTLYNPAVSLPTWRYARSVQTRYGNPLIAKGALAIIFVADVAAVIIIIINIIVVVVVADVIVIVVVAADYAIAIAAIEYQGKRKVL